MTLDRYRATPDVNWTLRSLMAAGVAAVCILASALTASENAEAAASQKIVDAKIADEARLVAEYAAFLAEQTEQVRTELSAPRLKPAAGLETLAFEADAAAIKALVDFDFATIATAKSDAAERRCLAEAIYYEARSESRIGQLAVADVVLNRVDSRYYPNTICDVVYQGSERVTGCQFSFTCDGSMMARRNARLWSQSEMLAGAILAGVRVPVSRQATHYHAHYVNPHWADKLTPTATIGAHKFYRFPDRRATAAAPAAM